MTSETDNTSFGNTAGVHSKDGVVISSSVAEGERKSIKDRVKEIIENGIDIKDNKSDPRTLTVNNIQDASDALNEWLLIYLTSSNRETFGLPMSGFPQVSDLQAVEGPGKQNTFSRGISMNVSFSEQNSEPFQVVVARKMGFTQKSGDLDTYVIGEASGFNSVEECLNSTTY